MKAATSYGECDKCGQETKLIDVSFRSSGDMVDYWICFECYDEDYQDAMALLDYND